MKVIIIENKSGAHSFVVREGVWTGLYDASLLLDEFLVEAAYELSEADYALPEDYRAKLLNTDAMGFCYHLNEWAKDFCGSWEFTCVRVPDMVIVDIRETATLLAALRLFQSAHESLKEAQHVLDIASDDGRHVALNYAEIETLIHKINYAEHDSIQSGGSF